MFFAALDATCIVCGTEIDGRHRWAKHFRAVYCSSTGVRVTVPLCPEPSHPAVRIPADAVTDEWVSERMPEHDQTDLYVFHEPCWRRLVSHFSPTEFDVGFVFEALEYFRCPCYVAAMNPYQRDYCFLTSGRQWMKDLDTSLIMPTWTTSCDLQKHSQAPGVR
ncbi:hypothetical protein AtubIFM56815_004136 [Aspergillus tubingensis]|uniref:Uncharacterized protein n=2 Tax=Aspergillus tubingensis TaxID=5068 RepID=A0A9W6AWI3_ASPTU|nr:hypothetical protein AtubIFM56815_004136 [Aspergillus tubingensis]